MTKCFYEYFSILPRSHSLEVLLGFEVELGLCANTAEREKQVFSPKDREKHVNVGVFYLRSSPMGRFCLPHLSWSLSSRCKK